MVMRRIMRGAISVLLLLAATATGFSSAANGQRSAGSEASYLVDFGSSLPANVEDVISAADGSVKLKLPNIGVVVASSSDVQFARQAQADPRVQSVAVDSMVGWLDAPDLTLQADRVKGSANNLPPD